MAEVINTKVNSMKLKNIDNKNVSETAIEKLSSIDIEVKNTKNANAIEAVNKNQDNSIELDADTNTYHIEVGVSAAEINSLIETADAGATIVLMDGTHEFNETIKIERDDINLTGESESGTTLNFTFPDGTGGNAIEISGEPKEHLSTLETAASAGSTEIILADTSGLEAGDVLYISLANTEEYLLENGWINVSFEDADARPFREMMVRIEEIDGNTVKLADPLAYDFEAGATKVYQTNLLEDVSVSNLTITSGIETHANYYDFVNDIPEFENTAVIAVDGADAISFTNISILDAPSTAFEFRSTIDLTADNLYVDGAHNLGGGGNGYGIAMYEVFGSTITDVEIYNVRHSVIFSSWNAEIDNYVGVTATNRDINFHGSPDHGNEVVVETAIMDYDPAQNTGTTNGFWDIVSEGGSMHAQTDLYQENTVTFEYAEGSAGSETIYAADSGGYIDGNGAHDTLYGGLGDDTLIGGTSKDQLTGNEGADIFIFETGDAYDTIVDFSGSEDGDRILIQSDKIQSFEELNIYQRDEDTVIKYDGGGAIILSDYNVSLLEAEFFIFSDPAMVA